MSRIVNVPSTMLHRAVSESASMYDHPDTYGLETGDIVLVRLPDSTLTYVVDSVRPAQFENFEKNLRVVELKKATPKQKEEAGSAKSPEMSKWRTGRSVGRTIYAMVGDIPSHKDKLIGLMDSSSIAQAAVEAHNAVLFGKDD